MSLTLDQIQTVPKVLLHDHLDGGLRPATMIELAGESGYSGLPTQDPDELTKILTAGAHRGPPGPLRAAVRRRVAVDLVRLRDVQHPPAVELGERHALRVGQPGQQGLRSRGTGRVRP